MSWLEDACLHELVVGSEFKNRLLTNFCGGFAKGKSIAWTKGPEKPQTGPLTLLVYCNKVTGLSYF